MKWVEFADKFPGDSEPCFKALSELNEELVKMSVLLGNGFVHSAADVIVFSTVHSSVVCIFLSALGVVIALKFGDCCIFKKHNELKTLLSV